MTAKHKNPHHDTQADRGQGDGEEKLFDFDRSFDEESEGNLEESEAPKPSDLEAALHESREKHLRLLAEFDNYKKRTNKERYELLNTASKNVLLALLPVLDDFERALKAMEAVQEESLVDGVRMIYNRLVHVAQSQGLRAMESTGEAFDPDFHEAITEVPVEDPTSRCLDVDRAGAVGFRRLDGGLALDHGQVPEPNGERPEQGHDQDRQRRQAHGRGGRGRG